MRRTIVAAAVVGALAAGATGAQASVGVNRSTAFADASARLRATWDRDVAQGVPAALIQPLRARLDGLRDPGWWSPSWWAGGPQTTVGDLERQTQAVWDSAMARARAEASAAADRGRTLLAQAAAAAPAGFAETVSGWSAALAQAATPAALDALAAQEAAAVRTAEAAVAQVRAQQAAAAAAPAAGGAVADLLAQVDRLDSTAQADNLDASAMDALAAQLRAESRRGAATDGTVSQLTAAVAAFRETVSVNDAVATQMSPLLFDIDQAVVEQTPGAASYQSAYQALLPRFTAARTQADLTAVQQAQTALRSQVDAELASNRCGHPLPAGKAIVISLTVQELVTYQDGCAVSATPVTTGRPQLRTPTGMFHVFLRTSPWTMRSPWPRSSPFWYPDTVVTWVLEFNVGGYFLHDAAWESPAAYGPGSENDLSAASHGCVHIPTPFMQWLYQWTPVGTPVQIVA